MSSRTDGIYTNDSHFRHRRRKKGGQFRRNATRRSYINFSQGCWRYPDYHPSTMKEEDKALGVVELLKAIADDPEVPHKYRIRAADLALDPNANPFSPPIRLTVANNKVLGHANFGASFEGSPGTVHGGFIAAAFDQLLFMTESLTGIPAMTGTLTVRYRKPTPLLTELVFEGVIDRVEDRKIFTRGTVSANGVVTAEAEGLFIAVGQV
ncbi:MAG: PaaI family thioesterase [Acidobacteria bacterium]|nr:PaaI family thioesterase [Acidobacteriota bacterium]